MSNLKVLKGRWFLILLIVVTLPFSSPATPLSSDIQVSEEIGPDGGYIMAEDPESGIMVSINFPAGALAEKTNITLIIYTSPHPGVLRKTYISGIGTLPEDLLLLEKASLHVYNPPGDVRKDMLLYHVVNDQFIIPLGSQAIHDEENWIEGTFYSTGRFCLGSPTVAEAIAQSKKLAAYNPVRPLAYSGEVSDIPAGYFPDISDMYTFTFSGGPYAGPNEWNRIIPEYVASDPAECMRWQRALTKVEAHMSWVQHFIYTNNPTAEQTERDNARDALQEAIDGYLNKPSPANRCSSYIKAAAKYTEAATQLGMNIQDEAPIAQHFNQLVNECSYVFTVETNEWTSHPREIDLGGMFESRTGTYTFVKCHVPWNEFIATGKQEVRGDGNMNMHYETHWVGDEKESHETIDASFKSNRIEGNIRVLEDEFGRLYREAHITIYWDKKATTRIWGRNPEGSYDESGSSTDSFGESKIYQLDRNNNWTDGDSRSGMSYKAVIIKQPGDGRYDPDDCF
jgi:hypothetical protein